MTFAVPLAILFGAAFTVAAATALGWLLLARESVSNELARSEILALSFLTGSALLSTTVLAVAALGFAYWQVFLGMGTLLIALAIRAGLPLPHPPRVTKWTTAFYTLGLFYLLHAMKPEASPDGATYHLGMVAQYWREHRFFAVDENLYAAFPKGMEMLYLFAFAFGRHSAAAVVHLAFLVALAACIYLYAHRHGAARAGAAAALLVFASPLATMNATTAYTDIGLAACGFGAYWLMELWSRHREPRLLIGAGLLAGFCAAIKYTGFIAVLYVAAAAIVYALRSRSPVALLACVPTLAVSAPYLVYNAISYSNPVLPFLNAWFPNPHVHVSFEHLAREWMAFYPGLESVWSIPWQLTVRGGITQGFFGPVFLLAPIALLSLRDPLGRKVLLAAAVFAMPFAFNMGARFLLPALPFLSLALAIPISRSRILLPAVLAIHLFCTLPPVQRHFTSPGLALLDGFPLAAALRMEPEEQALQRLSPAYDTTRVINRHVAPHETVFALAWVMEAYTHPKIRTHHLSANNERLAETLWTAITPDLQPSPRFTFRFPKQPARGVRIVQTSAATPLSVAARDRAGFILDRPRIHRDQWAIAELSLSSNRPTTIHASPNPWDAALALDGNPATAWKTWQPATPGMFFELDAGREIQIDEISFDSPLAQAPLNFRVEIRGNSGPWRVVSAAPVQSRAPIPSNMRRLAVAALKREGIDYLLIDPSLHGAGDFQSQPAAWNLELVEAASNGVRLYRLKEPQPPTVSQTQPSLPTTPP